MSFSSYLHHQFFNRLRLRAGHYKIPAQQQAVFVGRKFKQDTLTMRKIYFLTPLIICICFYSCNHSNTKAKEPSKSDSLQLFAYLGGVGLFLDTINVIHIVATLYNPTKDTMRFGSMTCSYEDFFTIDNDDYSIQSRYDCFSNYPNV